MLYKSKNRLLFISIIFAGILLFGIIGHFLGYVPGLSFLDEGIEFGMTEPLVLDLAVVKLTFGLLFRINIMSIIGFAVGYIVAKKVVD
ncbi:MAG: DUF4321 domain-containing protein [Clostridia bacterium]|nr:DUF4321 domain-containing protein [Clostridia bacterium]